MLHNLKTALAERGVRQNMLAIALGIPQSTLSEVVHCRRELELHLQQRTAEILRADREWLFSRARFIPAPRESSERQAAIACAARE